MTAGPARLLDVVHAVHVVEHEMETKLNEVGLSSAKLAALRALSDAGESMPLTQLADRLACVKSNITQLVDRLEADGLVARQLAPEDRRTRLAALTTAGRKAVKQGIQVQEGVERQVLGRLTVDEARQLAKLVGKMSEG